MPPSMPRPINTKGSEEPPKERLVSLRQWVDDHHTASLGIVIAVFFVLIIVLLFGGGNGNTQMYIDLTARAQELNRTSQLVLTQQNADTASQDLAATIKATMTNQEQQLATYLKTYHKKTIDPAREILYKDTSADSGIQFAASNDSLKTYYTNYLKSKLSSYQSALQTDFKTASAKAKPILSNAYSSNQVILGSI